MDKLEEDLWHLEFAFSNLRSRVRNSLPADHPLQRETDRIASAILSFAAQLERQAKLRKNDSRL